MKSDPTTEKKEPTEIERLNEKLLAFGRPEKCLRDDATAEQIDEARTFLFWERLGRSVPRDGKPDRDARLASAMVAGVTEQNPPGFLTRMFGNADRLRQEAQEAASKAEGEAQRVVALQERYTYLRESLKGARRTLERAHSMLLSWREQLAKIDSVDDVVVRFEAIVDGGYPWLHKANVVSSNRSVLVDAIDQFPKFEKHMLAKIAGIEAEIQKLESEFL